MTGGCGNLGLVVVRALLEHGASGVSLWDVHPNSADHAVRKLIASFPSAKIVTKAIDVRDEQRVREAVAQTVSELGSVDMLLCFAGVYVCARTRPRRVEADARHQYDRELALCTSCRQVSG